jgi:hypothetical protein
MHVTAPAPIRALINGLSTVNQESPMSELVVRSRKNYFPAPSTYIAVAYLFSLLGLVITAAIVPMIPSEDIHWVLSHIE